MSQPPDDIPEATSPGAPPEVPVHSGHEPTYRSAPPQSDPFSTPFAGSFPGYQLTREVRRGGQGLVFQAIQKTTRRKVAIKVMREGHFGDLREKARFEREVQILAQISHPGIVAIHDSGSTPSGQFYYVMDYISGQPLDTIIEAGTKPVDEVIALFLKICDAVTAAHLKGVIHRDLKPSNILIDAAGEPHVLDFGLAKVATGMVTAASVPQVMTITGQFMGSIPWASPEQAEGNPDKIDLRTDVYSLGVVLFQMLTGQFPYSVVGTMPEVLDRIRRQDPLRPGALNRRVDHEVETIVLKCLSKTRERRYQSAGELARDLRHYQAGEAIEAKRDSLRYVVGKQLRRYKFAVAVAAAFLLLLTTGLVVSLALWRSAEAARARAEMEADKAHTVSEFVGSMLGATQGNRDIMVRTALDDAAKTLDNGSLHPLSEAEVRMMLVKSYYALGLYASAEAQARLAERLRRDHQGTSVPLADSMSWIVWVLNEQRRFAEAEPLARRACEMYKGVIKDANDKDYKDIPESLNNLANALIGQGKLAEAEPICLEALEMKQRMLKASAPQGPIAYSLGTLAMLQHDLGKLDDAEASFREAIEKWQTTSGADLNVARTRTNYGRLLAERGRFAEAQTLFENSLELFAKHRVEDHPDVAITLDLLGAALFDQGRSAQAEVVLRRSVAMRQKPPPANTPAPEPWNLPLSRLLLGACLLAQGDPAERAEADGHLSEGLAVLQAIPPSPQLSNRTRAMFERIARTYAALNQPETAADWRARMPAN